MDKNIQTWSTSCRVHKKKKRMTGTGVQLIFSPLPVQKKLKFSVRRLAEPHQGVPKVLRPPGRALTSRQPHHVVNLPHVHAL